MRSANHPAAADPSAPLPIVANATADPAGELGVGPGRPKLADANAAIHVHTAYSSHMCPRYPKVASRVRRSRNTRAIADGSNGALFATYGPSPTTVTTSAPPTSASADAASISVRHGTAADADASRCGNAEPIVSAPISTPSAAPRRL